MATLAYIAGHFVRGQRLRFLVQRDASVGLATASSVVVVGYASNNLLPARLGELVRAGMLAERTGISLPQSLTVTFIERLLDGIAILFLLVVATLWLDERPIWIWETARLGSLALGAALAILLVAVYLPCSIWSAAARASTRLGPKARDRVLALATDVTSAGASLRHPRHAAALVGYSVAVWILESLMFASLLPAFGLRLHFARAMFAMSVTNLGILVPSSPGFMGTFHFFCSRALLSQGVASPTAIAYATLVHLTFYVPVTLWGGGALLLRGVHAASTAAMVRASRTPSKTLIVGKMPVHVIARLSDMAPPVSRPTAFELALVEALLPAHDDALNPAAPREVAAFVAYEMAALPSRLRLLYAAGMAAFRLYARLRYGRSFCRMHVQDRGKAVNGWAFGRIRLLRQLFRPPRAVALLAYYERADVVRALAFPATERTLRVLADG